MKTILAAHAQDWPPEDRELFPELVIALFSHLADQARGCDTNQELLELRAAARGLGAEAEIPGHLLLSAVLISGADAAVRLLVSNRVTPWVAGAG